MTDLQLSLAIEMGDGTVDQVTLSGHAQVVIGRAPSCHVVLPSPEVSRRHITIDVRPEGLFVTDSSANGTQVGREIVHRSTLALGDAVPMVVGPYVLRVSVVGAQRVQGSLNATVDPRGAKPPPPPPNAGGGGFFRNRGRKPGARGGAKAPPAFPSGNGGGGFGDFPELSKRPPPPPSGSVAAGPDVPAALRRRIHRRLLESLDLAKMDVRRMDADALRPKVIDALRMLTDQFSDEIGPNADRQRLISDMTDEALGLGPLEKLIADKAVSEIMVVDPHNIFVERNGKIELSNLRFTDDEAARAVIERIVTPLGRRIDESTPLVDARLKDGSRVNVVIRPLALRGSCITIRKFAADSLGMNDLVRFGSVNERMAQFLRRSVMVRKNIIISGGTGSGKTTLLNVLSGSIPEDERVVTIEDAAELQLKQPHVVSLETRPPNMEGKGEYSIRDLVKNSLRMRPDRIVVGECRGGEALDMLQAMNTGHEGSMTTTHANSPREAMSRLETLCLMSGLDLPSRAIREQIANSVHLVVQQTRFSDGSRRVTYVSEVCGVDDDGEIEIRDIFAYHRSGTDSQGKIQGEFRATGYLPSFLDTFITHGLVARGDYL